MNLSAIDDDYVINVVFNLKMSTKTFFSIRVNWLAIVKEIKTSEFEAEQIWTSHGIFKWSGSTFFGFKDVFKFYQGFSCPLIHLYLNNFYWHKNQEYSKESIPAVSLSARTSFAFTSGYRTILFFYSFPFRTNSEIYSQNMK